MIPLGLYGAARPSASTSLTLTYHGEIAATPTSIDPYTFSGVSIGDPTPNRTVLFVATRAGAPFAQIASVNIGGVAASLDAGSADTRTYALIGRAKVPLGTTADITVTQVSTARPLSLGIYSVDSDISVVDAASMAVAEGNTSVSRTFTTTPGGFILAGYASMTGFSSLPGVPLDKNLSLFGWGDVGTLGTSQELALNLSAASASYDRFSAVAYQGA